MWRKTLAEQGNWALVKAWGVKSKISAGASRHNFHLRVWKNCLICFKVISFLFNEWGEAWWYQAPHTQLAIICFMDLPVAEKAELCALVYLLALNTGDRQWWKVPLWLNNKGNRKRCRWNERPDGYAGPNPPWVIQSSVPLNTWLSGGITYSKWYRAVKGSERDAKLYVGVD